MHSNLLYDLAKYCILGDEKEKEKTYELIWTTLKE